MSDAREPPYPADTRAKGWRFEIDYEKVDQSSTWDIAAEVPMAQHALLMMWLQAWRQEPCGSFPNDPEVIRVKCRVPRKFWGALQPILLRGWWLAEDGRLYHDTIAARVLEMLESRRKNAKRVADFKAAQREQRGGNALPTEKQRENNDTGTGTILKKKPTASSAGMPTIPCPYDRIIDLYRERLPSLPGIRLMDPARQRALRKFWAWVLSSTRSDGTRRATNADDALAWIAAYFERASHNDWLMGRTERGGKHAGWKADLEFLLSAKGMKAVIERTEEAA